jgi:hypothetical protein
MEAYFKLEVWIKFRLCISQRLYSHRDEENRHKSGSKKLAQRRNTLVGVLTVQNISEGGKNSINRLEVFRKSENV